MTEWTSLTCESQKATQERINTLIGLTPATWESSAYLRQGGGSWADPAIPPRQRKEMLAQALGLDVWDRILLLARGDRVTVASERDFIGGQLDTLTTAAALEEDAQAALATAKLERDACRQRLVDLRASIEVRETAIREQAEAEERFRQAEYDQVEARRKHRDAREYGMQAHEKIEAIERDQKRKPDLERDAAGIETLDAALDEAKTRAASADADRRAWTTLRDSLQHDRELHTAAANAAAAAIERLEADQARYRGQIEATRHQPDATCHACGQALHDEARDRAIEGLEATFAGLMNDEITQRGVRDLADAAAKAAQAQYAALVEPAAISPRVVDDATAAAAKAHLALATLHMIETSEKHLDDLHATRARSQADVRAAEDAIVAAEAVLRATDGPSAVALRDEQAREQRLAEEAQRAVSEAEQRIGHADARLAQAIAARHHLDELRATATTLDAQLVVLDACIAAYGPNGIPALILETSAIPQIEAEANRVLAELGTEFRVELATQRAKRSSDGLIETLDVIVHGDQGARSFELFSGGEQTRINLALRLALSQLLAHRRGADVRVFLVDEPEGLDAAGMEAFARVLKRVEATFERIMVVSHHSDLRDSFDSVLEVERESSGASVLAGQTAAVAS